MSALVKFLYVLSKVNLGFGILYLPPLKGIIGCCNAPASRSALFIVTTHSMNCCEGTSMKTIFYESS